MIDIIIHTYVSMSYYATTMLVSIFFWLNDQDRKLFVIEFQGVEQIMTYPSSASASASSTIITIMPQTQSEIAVIPFFLERALDRHMVSFTRKRCLTNNLLTKQIWIPTSGSEIGMHVVIACILIHTIYSFHLYRYPSSSKSLIGNKS